MSHRRSDPVLQFDERYFNATYTNNVKTSGGSTDARDHAGNVTSSTTGNIHNTYWNFDAAGRTARWEEHVSYGDNTWKGGETKYDGDGRAVVVTDLTRHRIGGVWYDWDAQNSYNIYSSVTGQKVTELTATGEHAQTFVYMGGTKIARFDSEGVAFHVTDPMTGSEQQTADGSVDPESDQRIELAALGTNVPVTDPPSMPPPDFAQGGWAGGPEQGCSTSRAPLSCVIAVTTRQVENPKIQPKKAQGILLTRSMPQAPFADSRTGPVFALGRSSAPGDTSGTIEGTVVDPGEKIPSLPPIEVNVPIGEESGDPFDRWIKPSDDPSVITGTVVNCNFPDYENLTSTQRGLLDKHKYGGLDDPQKANFLNQTGLLAHAKVDLGDAQLQAGELPTDRLLFKPIRLEIFRASVAQRIQEGTIIKDKPDPKRHPRMSDFGGRQNRELDSFQVGFGTDGAFVDIDHGNPKGGLVGIIVHAVEVATPGKTDPIVMGRHLGSKITGYRCAK